MKSVIGAKTGEKKEKELREILRFLFTGFLGRDGTPEEYLAAIATIQKRYWLTPPELKAKLEAEFGPMYDPCPHPRPEGFDGLEIEWGPVNYVNPPFHQYVENGKTIGITDWIKKMLKEQKKGKTSLLVYPSFSWFHLLFNARAEMRSLGQIRWLAIEDGSRQKNPGWPIMLFILRGKKPGKKR
jgi:hypothetical protein